MITQLLSGILFSLFAVLPMDGYEVGDVVEDFSLPGVKGENVSLADFTDQKGVILVFDCNTCPVSQAYQKRIMALHEKYGSQGYPVVAVNPNDPVRQPGDSFEAMKAYAAKNNYQHNYLQDVDQSVSRAFGATNTPHTFVLENVNGDFVIRYIGAIDNNSRDASAADKKYVESAVDALLSGNTPEVAKTKAIGCTIKWKAS